MSQVDGIALGSTLVLLVLVILLVRISEFTTNEPRIISYKLRMSTRKSVKNGLKPFFTTQNTEDTEYTETVTTHDHDLFYHGGHGRHGESYDTRPRPFLPRKTRKTRK